MAEPGEFIKAEHGPGPLDGVQSAEGSADQFLVAGILAQGQQGRFQFYKNLARLFEEGLPVLIDRGVFRQSLTPELENACGRLFICQCDW
jgi:hypothetical protein